MGFNDHQGSSRALQGQSSRIFGRGFAAVDPERQREIDLEHARALTRRSDPSLALGGRAAPCGWMSAQRDPADEGGSVRRSTR
jgi:hypothetical protein